MRLFKPNYTLWSGLIDLRLTCHFYWLLCAVVSYLIKATRAHLGLVLNDTSPPIITSWILQIILTPTLNMYNQHGPQWNESLADSFIMVGSAAHQSQTESLNCKQRDYSSSFSKQRNSTWFVLFQRNSAHLNNKACGSVTLKSGAVKVFSFSLSLKRKISVWPCVIWFRRMFFFCLKSKRNQIKVTGFTSLWLRLRARNNMFEERTPELMYCLIFHVFFWLKTYWFTATITQPVLYDSSLFYNMWKLENCWLRHT